MHALIVFDTQNGSLGYFTIEHGGNDTLKSLAGPLGIDSGYAMAANHDTIVIANYKPAYVVTYNLRTKKEVSIGDPYGQPYDVAVDKQGTIYALNSTSVAVYKSGSTQPTELSCSNISLGEAVAVNNEGDVFVDGYGPGSFAGVVEYGHGSNTCTTPPLQPVEGYIAGVGVDPKTDDLITIDDPDLCAGGYEGRMLVYRKPYGQRAPRQQNLQATYCSGIFRLDASSTHIFYSDATVSDGAPLIDQARYPSGKYEGRYGGYYSSGTPFAGFTTLPNRLPN